MNKRKSSDEAVFEDRLFSPPTKYRKIQYYYQEEEYLIPQYSKIKELTKKFGLRVVAAVNNYKKEYIKTCCKFYEPVEPLVSMF